MVRDPNASPNPNHLLALQQGGGALGHLGRVGVRVRVRVGVRVRVRVRLDG